MVEFRTLGGLTLGDPGNGHEARSILAGPKRVAILAYLSVVGRATPVSRDALLAMFWPEASEARARNALNQVVFVLRRGLGPSILTTEGKNSIAIAADTLRCDAVEFEELLERGEPEEALKLYGGEFLEGFHLDASPAFERWLDSHRTHLKGQALRAALQLARSREEAGNPAGALPWYYRARELAPFDEALLRRMLMTLALLGDESGAVREFESYEERLASELGMEPSAELSALVQDIRSRDSRAGGRREQEQPSIPEAIEQGALPTPGPIGNAPSRRAWLSVAAVVVLASIAAAYVSVREASAPAILEVNDIPGPEPDLDPRFAGWAHATALPEAEDSRRLLSSAVDDFVSGRHARAASGFQAVSVAEPELSVPRIWTALSLARQWYASGHTADSLRVATDSIVTSFEGELDGLPSWDRHMLEYVAGLLAIDFPRAHAAIREAVQAAPGAVWYLELAMMAIWMDRPREVLDVLGRVDVNESWLEPVQPRYWSLVLTSHHRLGNYSRELELIRSLRFHPSVGRRVERLESRALIAMGRDGEVQAGFDERMASDQPGGLMAVESEYRAHGYRDLADRAVARIVDLLGSRPEEARDDDWRMLRARYLLQIDRVQEAEVLLEEIDPDSPRYLDARSEIGILAASRGDRDHALSISAELDAIPQTSLRTQYQARIAATLGDRAQAVRLLRQSESPARGLLHRELYFPSLIGYPPFQELERPRG